MAWSTAFMDNNVEKTSMFILIRFWRVPFRKEEYRVLSADDMKFMSKSHNSRRIKALTEFRGRSFSRGSEQFEIMLI